MMIHWCVLFQRKIMFVFRTIYQIMVLTQKQLTFLADMTGVLSFFNKVKSWPASLVIGFQSEIDNSTDFKWVENLFFEHVFSSGTVCTQWHVVWCINWLIEAELKWSDPELGQAVWLPLTEMKTSSGGLLCVDMFILHCSISEELQDKAVIHLHHHCLESRTLFASFDS